MKLERFFEKFELFAEAPDAVARMREVVLELAVRGKLVPQDSREEPASAQLKRIETLKAARNRPVRTKKRAEKEDDGTELILSLPPGWAMTTLANLVSVLNGRAYAKDELLAEGTPVLRVGNLFTNNHWYYSNLILEPDKYCDTGDLIFSWSASFGPFIWQGPKVIYHYHIWKLELHSDADLYKQFLFWFLQNRTQEIKRAGHGVSMVHMTKEKMEKLPVMLPPLAEQKRIVAKVDELMALCDHLEVQQQERQTRHAALVQASLARFTQDPTPANLQLLFHPSYTVSPADLRKTILTLAMQGRLVPQDNKEEPASAQLERIEILKAARNRSTRTKQKVAKEDDDGELISALPPGWAMTKLANLVTVLNGRAYAKEEFLTEGTPVLRVGNLFTNNHWYYSNLVLESDKYCDTGDLIFAWSASFGPFIWKGPKVIYHYHIWKLESHSEADIFKKFLFWFLQKQTEEIKRAGHGVSMVHMTKEKMEKLSVMLPPLAEQRRIVAKVEELLALVDELETQLTASRTVAQNLLAALVRELTTSP